MDSSELASGEPGAGVPSVKQDHTSALFQNTDFLGFPEDSVIRDYDIFRTSSPPRSNSPNYPLDIPELNEVFELAASFQPPDVSLTPHFKPFLPDLLPAIGGIDAFIKIPRPDGEIENLGLETLDEPSISQKNKQLFKMELRELFGVGASAGASDGYIGAIEWGGRNGQKELVSFLESIDDVQRRRPPPQMSYSYEMPEFEELMEPWPDELEQALQTCPLPTAELDLTIEEYAKVICALFEIPVKGNLVESLHHLFGLYMQFKGNQHFTKQE